MDSAGEGRELPAQRTDGGGVGGSGDAGDEAVDEICVLWLVPKAWEEAAQLLPQQAPLPFHAWRQVLHDERLSVRPLPDGAIVGGPWHGGQVVAVEDELTYHLFALPPAGRPLLEEALPTINDRAHRSLPAPAGAVVGRC
jgi:hypothetical protein